MKVVVASLNPAIERLLVVDRNEPGTVHRLRRSETLAGGKGVNVARVLAQLATPEFVMDAASEGVEPLLVGPLGGATGELQATLQAEEGLAAETVPIAGATRVNEVIVDLSAPDGATVYNAAGPALDADERHRLRETAWAALDHAGFLVCTGSLPPNLEPGFYAEWIAEARRRGIPSLLDAHGEALALGTVAAPSVVKVNRDEVVELANAASRTGDELVAEWIATGSEAVIVTDGAAPAVAHTASHVFEAAPPRVDAASAVGSGDAFTAGLIHSLMLRPVAGWRDHLALAAACGASNAASVLARLAVDLPPRALVADVRITERTAFR